MSIEICRVSKTYGAFKALRDISLTVKGGELVALLGPSGSGKTTLLRIIAGLELPDETPDVAVRFHNQDVSGRAVGERGVGFVFQHYALFRHMTVFENIAFGLRVRPWTQRPSKSAIAERVRELLRLVQLESLEQRLPSQLSGGQRQRVALARALATEPKVLLLDEPFGALDAKVRMELRRWLRRLHDNLHVTSVFVTHDQEEALEVADRIVVMNEGRIEQDGAPEELFHNPKTEFVMNFLGAVNLFHGRVEAGRVKIGPLLLPQDNGRFADGSEARAFVRPHEFEVARRDAGNGSMQARILRVQAAGALVKLELAAGPDKTILAELSHEQFRELNVRVGEHVYISARRAKIFVEDYSI